MDDLDRLYDTVRREKGSIDVLWASAGGGAPAPLGEITEAHFDAAFSLNARGTLFTVQKALPLFNDGGSILMTGSNASLGAFPGRSVYAGSKAVQQAWARVWLNELKDRRIRVNVLTPGQVATAKQAELFDEATRRQSESLIPAAGWAAPTRSSPPPAGRRRTGNGALAGRSGRAHGGPRQPRGGKPGLRPRRHRTPRLSEGTFHHVDREGPDQR